MDPEDTTPGDLDIPNPPYHPKEVENRRDKLNGVPQDTVSQRSPSPHSPLPPPAEPVPLRWSAQLRKVPTRPDNVYGDSRHPTTIESDIRRECTWRQMTGEQPGHPRSLASEPNEPAQPPVRSETLLESEGEVDDILRLQREGGVKFLDYLLAKAVPNSLESPDTAKVCEWMFRDILKMPSESQKEWKTACREELESL